MNKKRNLIVWTLILLSPILCAQEVSLISGEVTLNVNKQVNGSFHITFDAYGATLNSDVEKNQLAVVSTSDLTDYHIPYISYTEKQDTLAMHGILIIESGAKLSINDIYVAKGNGEFELSRNIKVISAGDDKESGFSSSFGLALTSVDELLENEYFIPGVWYRGNFEKEGNLPSHLPVSTDCAFLYREDRLPLPVVMMRSKKNGLTLSLVHKDSKCETTLNDHKNVEIDSNYQFGGIGVIKRNNAHSFAAVVTYPGSDLRRAGMGSRRHPTQKGFEKHAYKVYFKIHHTNDYPQALQTSWNLAFDLYNPSVYKVDLKKAYNGLLETINHYYIEEPEMKAPGFPWSVNLKKFTLDRNTYELGFVGCQPGAGYALFRAGVEQGLKDYLERGEKVLSFWAEQGLTQLGLPRARFAALNGTWDDWAKTTMRESCTGMGFILNAWSYAKRKEISKPSWLTACKKFGDFLVNNQNLDGSYYMEYDPFKIEEKKHPAGKKNKHLTICAVRYLVELYMATGEDKYRNAALAAAEFSYQNIHEKFMYVACVIDNPQTIDSESGQQALNAFLSMYDLTKEKRWLDAAEQAAVYTETWCYMFEIPVENDQTESTDWPEHRSIVGQHLIAIGHSAADLGFAWSSFVYYRLYLLTQKEHYLHVARISAHNTKQSMNLGQKLYQGKPEGLQQEAFQVKVTQNPRREKSIMEALTWNFTAHLDPMIRFSDVFGTYDLEEVEKIPIEIQKRLNQSIY